MNHIIPFSPTSAGRMGEPRSNAAASGVGRAGSRIHLPRGVAVWLAFSAAAGAYAQSAPAADRAPPVAAPTGTARAEAGLRTPLDRYVAAPDSTYSWKVVRNADDADLTTYLVEMTSQSWQDSGEVDRTAWRHWLVVVRPKKATSDTALLFISGGRNGGAPPDSADQRLVRVALATNTVVAELRMVPNQPLVFHGDGAERVEDDLIAYTWDHYLKTGDESWPAQLPMTKSAVRAMDTVTAVLADQLPIRRFVVSGGSKRGWTTWLTAAVDRRVVAIVPIVIDVLNVRPSMEHHWAAYGFWAPAIGDYVRHKIPDRRNWPRYQQLLGVVDPFAYRQRLTMPKCLINASGDEFFLPDSSQFYFDQLRGEKHLCYVPNAPHSLEGTDALDTLIAFHWAVVHGIDRPEVTWSFEGDAGIRVGAQPQPQRVLLWQATNSTARDFRVETLGRAYQSQPLTPESDGSYWAHVAAPPSGWTAFFVQLEFDIGAPAPLRLTTSVRVVPDTLPFADQQPPVSDQPQP